MGTALGGGAFSDTRVGWAFGGGLEWMFWTNWSAKVEYLHYDLGTVSTSPSVMKGATNAGDVTYAYAARSSTRFAGDIVRLGVNYHIDWGSPAPVASHL